MKYYYVYILTNFTKTTLYTGVTNDLARRVWEHKEKMGGKYSFTLKYNINRLVYYETHEDIDEAIHREKQIKRWRRRWKDEMITEFNSQWEDLAEKMDGGE